MDGSTQEVQKTAAMFLPRAQRGLRRKDAAFYLGMKPTKFDEMVDDGRIPTPRCVDRCRIWDIRELDEAFDNLPRDVKQNDNPWDE